MISTTVLNYNGRELEVALDYWMDATGVRKPMGLTEAWNIADALGFTLPTKDIVDFIWANADIKLKPIPIHYTTHREMSSRQKIIEHNNLIQGQLLNLGPTEGKLIAGHKKDILEHPRNSDRVKIYGWHQKNGYPIQPVSTVHHDDYFDYSHGLRLVRYLT